MSKHPGHSVPARVFPKGSKLSRPHAIARKLTTPYASSRHLSTAAAQEITALPDPLVFPPAALAPVPSGQPVDNLLLAAVAGQDVNLTVPVPANADVANDTLQLLVDGNLVDVPLPLTGTTPGEDFILALKVGDRTEGQHTISYRIDYYYAERTEDGPVLPFAVDLTAPGLPFLAPLEVAADIISGGLTPDKLATGGNGEYLPASVPGYQGSAVGDVIQYIINGVPYANTTELKAGDVGRDIVLEILRADIEVEGDGELEFTYRVTDRAGNTSLPSHVLTLKVLLAGQIGTLEAPEVPAGDDGFIGEEDARTPVNGIIPASTEVQEGDSIQVFWGTIALTPIGIPAGGAGADPLLNINVPYAAVFDAWQASSAGNDSLVTVSVTYQVLRGGLVAGTSPATAVQTNLFQAGGGIPDPESGINPNIIAPTVISSGGNYNAIPADDADSDATIIVSWLNNQTPVAVVFQEDDVLTVSYGFTPLAAYTITADDVADAVDLELTLDVATIAGEGSGSIKCQYTVSREVVGGGTNTVLSPPQTVTVTLKDDLPGGGQLAAGTYEPVNSRGAIGPDQAKAGVEFIIPVYTNKTFGDVITMTLALFPGSAHQAGETPISGTEQTFERVVDAADVGTVTRFALSEDKLMLPLNLCHTEPTYTIANEAGQVTSVGAFIVVDSRGYVP